MLCRKLIAENALEPGRGEPAREKDDALDYNILSPYFKEVTGYALLTPEAERALGKTLAELQQKSQKLAEKIALRKDPRNILAREKVEQDIEKARNKFVQANLRLVISIAKRYRNRGLELLDLISEGNVGLFEAARRFDYKRGCRFATYASWWIRQSIVKAIDDKGVPVRIPINKSASLRFFRAAQTVLSDSLEHEPTKAELAEYLGWTRGKVREHMLLSGRTYTSLETTIGYSQGGDPFELKDALPDEAYTRPEEAILDVDIKEHIQEYLSELTAIEKNIVELRFGLNGRTRRTLKEIGDYLQLSRERVRQIEVKALHKLRASSFAYRNDYIEGQG